MLLERPRYWRSSKNRRRDSHHRHRRVLARSGVLGPVQSFGGPLDRGRVFRRGKKGFPAIRWVVRIEHLLEDPVGVGLAAVSPKRLVVVHPGQDDDLRLGAEAEEEPEPAAAELGAEPVLTVLAESAAQAEPGIR